MPKKNKHSGLPIRSGSKKKNKKHSDSDSDSSLSSDSSSDPSSDSSASSEDSDTSSETSKSKAPINVRQVNVDDGSRNSSDSNNSTDSSASSKDSDASSSKVSIHIRQINVDELSEATSAFLNRLRQLPKHSALINSLELKPDEVLLLENFNDPLTHLIMDEPVLLNGRVYDLSSITRLPVDGNGWRKDPVSNFKFRLQNLQPALELVICLHDMLDHLHQARKKSAVLSAAKNTDETDEIRVLQQLSPSMRAYLGSETIKNIKYSEKYQNLSQNDKNALKEFNEFFDSETGKIIDVPVMVNGNIYNLQTLLDLPATDDGQRQEPRTNFLFYLRDIQPDRYTANAIRIEFARIQCKRSTPESSSVPELPPAVTSSTLDSPEVAVSKLEPPVASELDSLPVTASAPDSPPGPTNAPHAVLFKKAERSSSEGKIKQEATGKCCSLM
jgi:hypothetical protein